MAQSDDKTILDKKAFSFNNIWGLVVILLFVFAPIVSGYIKIVNHFEQCENITITQTNKDDLQDNQFLKHKSEVKEELKKIGVELDKEVYNAEQLAYRLNSAQTKRVDEVKELQLKQQEFMIREQVHHAYVVEALKEIKTQLKEAYQ